MTFLAIYCYNREMILDFEELKKRRKMKRKLPDFSKKGKESKPLSERPSTTTKKERQEISNTDDLLEYGTDYENRVLRVKLIFRGGDSVSIPYAHNPVIIANNKEEIFWLTDKYRVIIAGRNLSELEAALCFENVTWIAETPEEEERTEGKVFIEDIFIDGELFER